jgi:hypothetical protein
MRLFGPATVAFLLAAACGGGESDDAGGTPGEDAGTPARPGETTDGGQISATCPEGMKPTGASSLVFDGVDDHVTMGVAPELGLDKFTVEAWVRRDGRGVAMGTGVGGLSLVPIVGKGRGEDDGSVRDCNYAIGFAGDVIGADFEDTQAGANHPVFGKTKVPFGEWHHVAVSYDGAKWQIFLDGKLDAEATATGTPRKDSTQHFGIGAGLNSTGVAAGALHGALDEVRVWKRARTEAEIATSMHQRPAAGDPDLAGRWALDKEDGTAKDALGKYDGTLMGGAAFADVGVPLDLGTPPTATAIAPKTSEEVAGPSTELSVSFEDADSSAALVTFHVRRMVDEDDFSIVVLPDTQYYTDPLRDGNDYSRYFYDQTKWIVDNRDTYNIKGVIHNGDIVNHGPRDAEWRIADRAMKTLETVPGLTGGVPYGTCAGNHDLVPFNETGGTTQYNKYFGPARFAGRPYVGGSYQGDKNDENWVMFSAGGLDFIVLSFQYSDQAREAPVLAWARSVFQRYPEAFGVVNSHAIVTPAGSFSPAGKSMYDTVKDLPNVHLMTNGHYAGEKRRTDTFEGHTVTAMLADYQGRAMGGSGWMRIWEFSPKSDELTVRSYSPTLDKFEVDAESEFTIKVNLKGTGGAFQELAKVDAAGGTAKAVLDGLEPGQAYEWYATVTDCTHTFATRPERFRTK